MRLERRGKIFIIAIIVGVITTFTLMYISAITQANILEKQLDVELVSVEPKSIDYNNDTASLEVTFKVINNSPQVIAVRDLNYELTTDGNFLCKGGADYGDIPLGGRPQVFSNAESGPIRTECKFKKNDNLDMWNRVVNNQLNNITWRTKGSMELESSYSVIPKDFDLWLSKR